MNAIDVFAELQSLTRSDFESESYSLVERWTSSGVGIEAVEPILRFMEENPEIDFGPPGSLVHFVERFYRTGYQEKLLASLERRPTEHTVWMMNRVINGTKEVNLKHNYIGALKHAREHAGVDEGTRKQIDLFLKRLLG